MLINDRSLEEYFGRETDRMIVLQPFGVTQAGGSFDVEVNVKGGGTTGQAGAIRHGITRALMQVNSEFRPPLKKAEFCHSDPRAVERKKYGRHKARKQPQYSKRSNSCLSNPPITPQVKLCRRDLIRSRHVSERSH